MYIISKEGKEASIGYRRKNYAQYFLYAGGICRLETTCDDKNRAN